MSVEDNFTPRESPAARLERLRIVYGMPHDWLEYTVQTVNTIAGLRQDAALSTRCLERQRELIEDLTRKRTALQEAGDALVAELVRMVLKYEGKTPKEAAEVIARFNAAAAQ